MPSWTTEDEKQLLLTIIDLLHINKLPNWQEVSGKLGRGYSHEACRQHFQKLRRNPNSSSPSTRSPTKSRIQKTPSTPRTPSKRKIQELLPSPPPPPEVDDDEEVVVALKATTAAIAPPDYAPGNESPTKKIKTEEEKRVYEESIRRPVFKHEGNYVDLEEDEDLYAS